jgi:hypothetical protein
MTRNERIAEQIEKVMGWVIGRCFVLRHWNDVTNPDRHNIADLLEQRMVDDGWTVILMHSDVGFDCSAFRSEPTHHNAHADSRPAAIRELFCLVYGIKEKA